MKKAMLVLLGVCCLGVCAQSFAADEAALKKENDALKARVANLEAQLGDIQAMLKNAPWKKDGAVAVEAAPASSSVPVLECVKGALMDTTHETGFYGYIKADMAHDTARMAGGNMVVFVQSEATRDDDDEFNMTARESRIGFKFKGPDLCNLETSGKIELDFYGDGSEDKAEPRMRHAFLNLHWAEQNLDLLAGQTWDIISPLNTPTLNFAVNGDAGNIGYRRPQVRVTKGFDLFCDSQLKLEGGVVRTIGEDGPQDPGDTGEDAGFPTMQGRISYATPLWMEKKAVFGLSGHWGEEEYDIDAADHHETFDTWSMNFDLALPITQKLTLLAEVFTGSNLDAYFGGVGQGVNTTTMEEIEAWGGWVALCYAYNEKWSFNLGAGFDDPEDDDLSAGQRESNTMYFANMHYLINKYTKVSFEVSHWDTEYKDTEDGDALRFQSSLTYQF